MSEHLHDGVHLDPDSLSAFVEGVLPEHERAQCLAHLAECARCREIVYLSQAEEAPATVAPAPVRMLASGRRFKWMPLMAAAATVCITMLGAWWYLRTRGTTMATTPELVARLERSTSPAVEAPPETVPRVVVVKKAAPGRRGPATSVAPPTIAEPPRAPVPPPVVIDYGASRTVVTGPVAEVAAAPKPPVLVLQTQEEGLAGITGTVTDPSGAVVAVASVQLRELASGRTTNGRTDQAGQFKFAGLAPGQYELQINAPGFQRTLKRVELQAREVASVKSELQIGSTAETVEVTAAEATVQTSSSAMSSSGSVTMKRQAAPQPLPSKLATGMKVTHGKVMVAIDVAGALWASGNSGKSWKAVKVQWPGQVANLAAPPNVAGAGKAKFQLTTDAAAGSIWLSRDGRHWYAAPPQH